MRYTTASRNSNSADLLTLYEKHDRGTELFYLVLISNVIM